MTIPLSPDAHPRRRAAVERALARCGLHPSLARSVETLLDRAGDDWRVCCGSACDPCILPLGRAVDLARAELGIGGATPGAG